MAGNKEISSQLLCWLLVILVVVAFGTTLFGGFVFDDRFIIVDNQYLASPGEWSRFFTEGSWAGSGGDASNYRALPLLSYGLNYLVGGLRPFGYHLVNLLLHMANVLLLFALGQRLGLSKYSAWLASAIFAVHPLQTEPVAEIVGRMDLMAATGVLGALLCHVNARATHSQPASRKWFLGAVLLYAFALWSKEHTILFPLVAAAVDLSTREAPRRRTALPYLAYAAVGGLYLWVWFCIFQVGSLTPSEDVGLSNPLALASGPLRFVSALWVAGLYLGHLVWPVNLSPDYCYSQILPLESLASGKALLTLAGTFLVLFIGIRLRRKDRVVGVGLLLAVAMFLPVSNLLFPIGTVMGDRLFYLPVAGLSLAVGAIVGRWAPESVKKGLSAATWVVLVALTIASLRQSQVWRTDFTLNQQAVRAAPRCARGHNNLGYDLLDRGEVDAAHRQFRTAVEIYSPYPQAQAGLARVAYQRRDWSSALRGAEDALAIKPDYWAMMHLAANAALQQGDSEIAAEYWSRILEIEPDDTQALANLGALASSRGEHREAIDWWTRAVDNPDVPPTVIFTLAQAYDSLEQPAEALVIYQLYLQRADPNRENPASIEHARDRVAALQDSVVSR